LDYLRRRIVATDAGIIARYDADVNADKYKIYLLQLKNQMQLKFKSGQQCWVLLSSEDSSDEVSTQNPTWLLFIRKCK
jgi:hypothetical protein